MRDLLTEGLIALQIYVTLFVGLHDWIPLGRFNNVQAIRATEKHLAIKTLLSTTPFAFGLVASLICRGDLPGWLWTYLLIAYGVAAYGFLRTWWAPYLLFPEPDRARRYQAMHGKTHNFLPIKNGMRPNSLHVTIHLAILLSLLLLVLLGMG